MKTTFKTLAALALIFSLASFKDKGKREFIGTFGVAASDPAQIKLTINSDQTFYYQDFSDPNKKDVIQGTWTADGDKLKLKSNDADQNFRSIWTITENGDVAKSRKGLSYYRLCKING